MRKRLVWLVISAAFIGPGTVTTATKAGAEFGLELLWTILFAAFACYVLQEGVGRAYLSSNLSLGQAIMKQFEGKRGHRLGVLSAVSVVLGSAAYEAGNILGAVSGVTLYFGIAEWLITAIIVAIVGSLLFLHKFQFLTNFLGGIIGLMGIGLLILVFLLPMEPSAFFEGLLVPSIPPGAHVLTLALVGTTVVPYNLFLGSRLAKGQSLNQIRSGLAIAVTVGGLISLALIMVGSQITDTFSFQAVGNMLLQSSGKIAMALFAFGLFSAGITSSLTAPWAAAEAIKSTAGNSRQKFMVTWMLVLGTGLIFGLLQVKPVPVIILAQAVNGLLLPFLAIVLLLILNNREIMNDHVNGKLGNTMLLLVIWVTGILGGINLLKAGFAVVGMTTAVTRIEIAAISAISLLIVFSLTYKIIKKSN